jgi:hypothetical protein
MSKETIDYKIESFLSRKTKKFPELDAEVRAIYIA